MTISGPRHLERLRALIEAEREIDFAVSGCVYYGPRDSEVYYVTGLFEDASAPFLHFFPPTSLAHKRNVIDRIGGWCEPRTVAAPVDCDFLLRAARAGLRFSSTKEITAHKFAAGHRYLSYLNPDAEEQWAAFNDPQIDSPASLLAIIEKSRQRGYFMIAGYLNYSQLKNGQLFDENRSNKGILRPALKELEGRVVIEQIGEPRALDWHGLEQGNRPFRWSGPNPKPKILIPYAYPGEVEITLCIPFALTPLHKISIWMNGHPVHYDIPRSEGVPTMVLRTNLNESDYSILTLHTEMTCPNEHFGNGDFRWVGLAISDIIIEPLDHQSNLRSTRGPR